MHKSIHCHLEWWENFIYTFLPTESICLYFTFYWIFVNSKVNVHLKIGGEGMHLSTLLWRLFKILGMVAWLGMGLNPAQVFAEDLNKSVSSSTLLVPDEPEESPSPEKNSYIGTRSLFYINKNIMNTEARSLHYFEGRVQRDASHSDKNFGMDLEGQFASSQEGFNSFSLNELYWKTNFLSESITFAIGRRTSQWSLLDDHWKLGAYQPVYRMDPLNPSSQGLTGLFLGFKGEGWNVEFFGTPVFTPDQGAPVETVNGRFVKKDPWIFYPPPEINVNGVLTPATYEIDRPSIQEVVSNKGFGVKAQVGQTDEDGVSGRAGWAYKPMNQLLLGLSGHETVRQTEESPESEKNTVDIRLHPEVGYHQISSIDLAYRFNSFLMTLGVVDDRPMKHEFASQWTYQNYLPSQLMGGGIEFSSESGWRVGAHYLKRQGGESQVLGPEKDLVGPYIPERYSFAELVQGEMVFQKRLSSRWGYEGSGEWRKELSEGSELYSLKGALLMGSFWKAYLGLDFMKSENKNPQKKDFIEANLANDRVYGGVHYVF